MKDDENEPQSGTSLGLGAVVEFIEAKLTDAEKALKSRKEAEATWSSGTDASWRRAGCPLAKEQRLKVAAKERSIAAKCQREVDLFKATLSALQAPNKNAIE